MLISRLSPVLLLAALAACDGKEQGIDTEDDDTNNTDTDTSSSDIAGDDIGTAYEVTWEDGSFSVEETIGSSGDRDFFAIPMEAGTQVAIASYAYAFSGETEPDTVIRLYDEAGNMIWENDDMPYRIYETDSAMFFEATYSGYYYLEVLEWGDWAGEGGSGGPSFEYELVAAEMDTYETEPINDDPAKVSEYIDPEAGVYAYVADPFASEETMFMGDISKPGDVDYYPLTVPEPDKTPFNGLYYAISFFGQPMGNLSPEVAVVDLDGNVIAQTTDPIYSVDRLAHYDYRGFWYDFKIFAYMEPGEYFLRVRDTDSKVSGDGTFYAGIFTGGYYDSFAPNAIDQDQNQITNGTPLELDKKNFNTIVSNRLGEDGDMLDSFAINVSDVPFGTKYLDVFVMAEQYGSLLDAKVTIYGADGTTVIHEATTNTYNGDKDPEFIGLELPEESFFVVVEPEGGVDGLSDEVLANNYLLFIGITEAP